MPKKAVTWRDKMTVANCVAMLCLCVAMTSAYDGGGSGGYGLELGLTLREGYCAGNIYIVNITYDGSNMEASKTSQWLMADNIAGTFVSFSMMTLQAYQANAVGRSSPVGTFVELPYSMRACTERMETGVILEGKGLCEVPMTVIWKAPENSVGNIMFVATMEHGRKSYTVKSTTVHGLTPQEENIVPQQLMKDHPYFVVVPANQSVALGEPATFHCKAVADSDFVITWAFHGRKNIPLPYNNRHRVDEHTRDLTILDVEEGDLGRYSCQVIINNERHQQHAWLSKFVKPRITHHVYEYTVKMNHNMLLECHASGTPTPKFMWFWNEQVLKGRRYKVSHDGALQVQDVRVQDSGMYTCVAHNLLGEDRADVQVDVLYPPQIYNGIPKPLTKVAGDMVDLKCSATGNPKPRLYWLGPPNSSVSLINNTREIPEDNGIQYYIDHVQPSDAGRYRCEAVNSLGKDTKDVELVVQEPPKFVNNVSKEEYRVVNESVHVYCNATGNPKPTVKWFYNSAEVPSMEYGGPDVSGAVLKLDKVQKEDAGNYTCLATSSVGRITAVLKLIILYAPAVEVSPTEVVVEAGQHQLTLTCHVTGSPKPMVQWYVNGQQLVSGDRVVVTDNLLTLYDIQANDTGYYDCNAENYFGTAQAWSYVFVQVPPTIQTAPTSVSIHPGEMVKFSCEATGIPRPVYVWDRDNITIYNGSQYSVNRDSGDLTVLETDPTTGGLYTCHAVNDAGTDTAAAWIRIYMAPTLIYTPPNGTYLQGSAVMVVCLAVGYPEPQVTWTYEGEENRVVMGEETGVLSIEKVTMEHAGLYQCNASNSVGWSADSVYITVHTPPRLTVRPSDQAVFPGQAVVFSCNATGVPAPRITWTFHHKTPNGQFSSANGQFSQNQTWSGDLWILDAGYGDQGIYQCLASNAAGNITTTARLNILTASNITNPPSNLTIVKGTTAKFPCGAVGFPPPDVTWTFQNTTIDTGNGSKYLIEKTGTLVVKRVNLADVGWYLCTAHNSVGKDVAVAYLTVHVGAYLKRLPEAVAVNNTQDATFYCEAGGIPPPQIRWLWEDSPVLGKGMRVTSDGSSLSIRFASYYHEGRYTCEASNVVGNRRAERKVQKAHAKLNINRKPSVYDIPSPKPVDEGKDVILRCRHDGYPSPKVKWIHNYTKVIRPNKNNIVSRSGSLHILRVRWEDKGLYMCKVWNSLGTDMAKTELLVWVKPKFTVIPPPRKEIFVYERNMVVQCRATGSPMPEILWYKDNNGNIEPLSYSTQMDTDTGDLIFLSVTGADQGRYVCRARSDAGNISTHIYIAILVPPEIQEAPTNQSVTVGGTAKFTCKASGQPEPVISWTYQTDLEIPNDQEKYNVSKDGELTILDVARQDQGFYECRASSRSAGNARAVAGLTVHGPPVIVEHPKSVVPNFQPQFLMGCYATGEGPLRYRWKKRDKVTGYGTDKVIGSGTRILLPENSHGYYTCEVSNHYGTTKSHTAAVQPLDFSRIPGGREQLSFDAREEMTFFVNRPEFQGEFYSSLTQQLAAGLNLSSDRIEYLQVSRGSVTFDLVYGDKLGATQSKLLRNLKQSKGGYLTIKFGRTKYQLKYKPPPDPTTPKPVPTRLVEVKVPYPVTVRVPCDSPSTTDSYTQDTGLKTRATYQDDDINVGVLVGTVVGTIVFLSCIFIAITVWRSYFAEKKTPKSPHNQFSFLQNGFGAEAWGNRGDRFPLEYHPPSNMIRSKPMGYLTLKRLVDDIKSADEGVLSLLKQEFESVPLNQAKIHHTPCGTEQKNRYMNVLPNPHTSVKLLQLNSDSTTEYINANHIRGYDRRQNAYIAAQGPLGTTRQDFWRMVWEQNVDIIVMTTGLVERDRVKCARYWPNSSGKTKHEDYGDLIVTVLSEEKSAKYTITRMELQHKDAAEVRHIWHYWYTSWPDFGVPDEPDYILDLLEDMNSHRARSKPVIVHCSAGLGRTGAFIGIDMGMEQILNESIVDPLLYFTRIRQDRGGSVQTLAQYIFIHQVLLLFFERKRSELAMQPDLTRLSMGAMSQGTNSLTQLTAML